MKITILLILLLATAFPILALANQGTNVLPNLDKDPDGTIVDANRIFKAISDITDWIFSIFLVLAVLFILIGAYNILISKGNPEGFDQGKKMVLYAVIAVAVAVLAKSIVVVTAKIVGVTIEI